MPACARHAQRHGDGRRKAHGVGGNAADTLCAQRSQHRRQSPKDGGNDGERDARREFRSRQVLHRIAGDMGAGPGDNIGSGQHQQRPGHHHSRHAGVQNQKLEENGKERETIGNWEGPPNAQNTQAPDTARTADHLGGEDGTEQERYARGCQQRYLVPCSQQRHRQNAQPAHGHAQAGDQHRIQPGGQRTQHDPCARPHDRMGQGHHHPKGIVHPLPNYNLTTSPVSADRIAAS